MKNCTYNYNGKNFPTLGDAKQYKAAIKFLEDNKGKAPDHVLHDMALIQMELSNMKHYQKNPGGHAYANNQMGNATAAQKQTVNGYLNDDAQLTLDHDTHIYTHTDKLGNTTQFTSVSEYLKANFDQYGFNNKLYDEDAYDLNREWGNQIDVFLSSLFSGMSYNQALNELYSYLAESGNVALIDEQALTAIEEGFGIIKKQFPPNTIFLSQVKLFNAEKQLAGAADIIAVTPDGDSHIIDIKSSLDPFTREYEKNGYKNSYNRDFRTRQGFKWSKQSRHRAQTSLYMAMAAAHGRNPKSIGILPIHITGLNEDIVTQAEVEGKRLIQLKYLPLVGDPFFSDELFEGTGNPNENVPAYNKVIEEIKKTLQEYLIKLKSKDTKSNRYKSRKIEETIGQLDLVTKEADAVAKFVDSVYTEIVRSSEDKDAHNFALSAQMDRLLEKIKNELITPEEAIFHLGEIEDTMKNFQSALQELDALYNDYLIEDLLEPEEGSTLDKISTIRKVASLMDSKLNNNIYPLIAKQLSENANFDEDTNKAVKALTHLKEKNEDLKKKLEEAEKENPKSFKVKRLKSNIKSNETKIERLQEQVPSYENILHNLKTGASRDVSWMDAFAGPSSSSSNVLIATWTRLLSRLFEEVRHALRKDIINFSKEVDMFKKASGMSGVDPAKFNQKFFEERIVPYKAIKDEDGEVVDYETDYFLIDKFNWSEFEKFRQQSFGKKSQAEKALWWQKNAEKLQDEDYTLPDPDDPRKKIIIRKGFKTVLKEKQEEFKEVYGELKDKKEGQKDWEDYYRQWYENNTFEVAGQIVYGGALAQPKESIYGNTKYASLNKHEKRYYEKMLARYLKYQQSYPEDQRLGFQIPSVQKSYFDRYAEKGVVEGLKESVSHFLTDSLTEISDDYQALGERGDVVPILFSQPMDKKDKSLDLAASILLYGKGARHYEARSQMVHTSRFVLKSFGENPPVKTNSLGKQIISRAAQSIGIDLKEKKESHESNLYSMAAQLVDVHIYGKTRQSVEFKVPIINKKLSLDKLANSLMSFASLTQIAYNPMLAVANSLQAQSQLFMEAIGGEHFSKGAWGKALVEYNKYELSGDFVKDMSEPYKKTFIGQLTEMYDVLQGEHVDQFGRNVSMPGIKQHMNLGIGYMAMRKGEHRATTMALIAKLEDTKVVDRNGDRISLYEAYKRQWERQGREGILGLDDVDLSQLGQVTGDGTTSFTITKELHGINKRMHGVYNSFDRELAQRTAVGRLVFMYRKFFLPGVKRRFKATGYNLETGHVDEGIYRTFWRVALTESNELLALLSKKDSTLTEYEKSNIRKTATEYAMIILLGLIVKLLQNIREAGDDDDPEVIASTYALFFAMRLRTELNQYLVTPTPDPYDFARMMMTFTVAEGTIKKAFKFINQMVKDLYGLELERYKRDEGVWKKGDPKLKAYFFKLLGYTGVSIEPETAIKNLELSKLF